MKKKTKEMLKSVSSLVLSLLALLTFRWLIVEPYVIPTGSMIPSLLIHDHILVYKSAFGIRYPGTKSWFKKPEAPKRGDVVVFRSVEDDGFFLIKRVVGLPGDKISYLRDGQLIINGETLQREPTEADKPQKFYKISALDLQSDFSNYQFFVEKNGEHHYRTLLRSGDRHWEEDLEFTVPEGQLFTMGDNRDNSKDSRYWGTLPLENLLGKALFIWLSCERTFDSAPFLCNPMSLRWSRFFQKID